MLHFYKSFGSCIIKTKFSGYWNKDVDDSQKIQLQSVIQNNSFLAEIELSKKTGSLELTYTATSLAAKINWAQFHAQVQTILQFESKHVELMLSVKSSLQALKEVTLHILLASTSTPAGKATETKVVFSFCKLINEWRSYVIW